MIYALPESKSLAVFCQPRPSLSLILPYQAITDQVLKELLMLMYIYIYISACGTSDRDEVSNRELLGEHILHFIVQRMSAQGPASGRGVCQPKREH